MIQRMALGFEPRLNFRAPLMLRGNIYVRVVSCIEAAATAAPYYCGLTTSICAPLGIIGSLLK
jgi:hypothetical protein